jgi:endonuclease/exonuclease/phosphatase family metal-dependent hydrolase
VVRSEVRFLVAMIALPLLTLPLGRVRWLIVIAAAMTAAGRVLMVSDTPISQATAAALAFGGGLLYIAMMVRYRAQLLPYMFVLAFGIDQFFRAAGNTLDPSWSPNYFNVQLILGIAAVALSIIGIVSHQRQTRSEESGVTPDNGLLPFWGGIGLGGLLFLELSLLGLPNAIAGRASVDYTAFVPVVLAATLLPLIPWVRRKAHDFIVPFDSSVRGWAWMLLAALLLVIGIRTQGILAGAALVLAQFAAGMMWWWLVRPRTEHETSFTGLWLPVGILIFALLAVGDLFTYEYAFVRNFTDPLTFLNRFIPPLLRGFRGMGLGVLLLAMFMAGLPMIQTRRRIPWRTTAGFESVVLFLVVIGSSIGAAWLARPPLVTGVRNPETIRVGTYNLHAGYNEFFHYDLEAIARTIQASGANVVLLPETEAGRLTSFGVDQSLWLARRLGMDRRFYPTNEGIRGLAILSDVEIVFNDGSLLTSVGEQTGLQRVQIRPDTGIITVYNTWLGLLLEAPGEREISEQEQDQERQLREILALIANQHPDGRFGRMIIGGTFNNIPDSPLIDQMRAFGFNDPFAGNPIELSATLQRTGQPRVRIDYIWTRPPLLNLGVGVMDSSASDHRMATVEVRITSQTP